MSFIATPAPPTRSTRPAADIDGFFTAVNEALKLHLKTVAWPTGTYPTLIHAFPRERLAKVDDPFDVITFSVLSAEMAPTSNDGSRVPRGPIILDGKTQEYMGYNTATLMWWEEATVQFHVWSRSNKRADDMTTWFHRFLMSYAHAYQFFRARGVEQFRFVGRGRDEAEVQAQQELYHRTLTYKFRIQYLQTLLDRQLESVTISLAVDRQTDTIERP